MRAAKLAKRTTSDAATAQLARLAGRLAALLDRRQLASLPPAAGCGLGKTEGSKSTVGVKC